MVKVNPFAWKDWKGLLNLQDTRQVFYGTPIHDGVHHLYSDGSCWFPRTRWRLAAWGLVLMDNNLALVHGVVCGLQQTSMLAELYAIYSALCWAVRYSARICIHNDCDDVVTNLKQLRRTRLVPQCWKYGDVWQQVLEVLHLLDNDTWEIHHVYSHQDPAVVTDPLQEWFISGNFKADRMAERAHATRPLDFQHNHRWLLAHEERTRLQVKQQLDLLTAIANEDLKKEVNAQEWDPESIVLTDLVQESHCNERELVAQVELEYVQLLPPLSDGFSLPFRTALCEFIFSCDQTASTAKSVLSLEFLAAFLIFTSGRIPIPHDVGGVVVYQDPDSFVGSGLIRPTYVTATGILLKAIKASFRSLNVVATWERKAKPSIGVFMQVWSLRMGWPDSFVSRVDEVVSGWFASRPVRKACDLARPISGY